MSTLPSLTISTTNGESSPLSAQHDHLKSLLMPMGRVIVAFSGGVDSTLVLKLALGATGISPSLPQRELDSVQQLAEVLDAPLQLVQTSEMDSPNYTANPTNRCYFCKTELYSKLTDLAQEK